MVILLRWEEGIWISLDDVCLLEQYHLFINLHLLCYVQIIQVEKMIFNANAVEKKVYIPLGLTIVCE